jgi:hypothetical protein
VISSGSRTAANNRYHSYSKITYSSNSHTSFNSYTVIIHIQVYIVTNYIQAHIHKFTNTINIDIAIYNLQHTSLCIICILSSVVRHTQDHIKFNIYLQHQNTSTKDISSKLLRLLTCLLLHLLSGLLLLRSLQLLPFSFDIPSK